MNSQIFDTGTRKSSAHRSHGQKRNVFNSLSLKSRKIVNSSSSAEIFTLFNKEEKGEHKRYAGPNYELHLGIGKAISDLIKEERFLSANVYPHYKSTSRVVLLEKAVRNLFKRVKFLELNIDLLQEFISEKEFESELDNNPGKYVIKLDSSVTKSDVRMIKEIVVSLDIDASFDEVAEIFGVEYDEL